MTTPVYTWLGVGVRMPQHRKLTSKGRRKSEQNDDFVEDDEEGGESLVMSDECTKVIFQK